MSDSPPHPDQIYPLSEPLVYRIAALPMADAVAYAKLRTVLKPEYFAEDPDAPLRVIVDVMLGHIAEWKRPPSWELLAQLVTDRVDRRLKSRRSDDAGAVRTLYRQMLTRLREADVATDRSSLEAAAIAHAEDQALARALLSSAELLGSKDGDRLKARRQIQQDLAAAMLVGAPSQELGTLYSETIVDVFEQWASGEWSAGKIATGWHQLDPRLEGGIGRELVVIAGEAHSFKTGLCVNLGAAAMAQGKFVAHATLEGEAPVIQFRYGRRVARIRKQLIRGVPLEILQASLLRHKVIGGEVAVRYFPRRKAGADDLEAWLHGLTARGRRPDMLIVDYADKMAPPGRMHYQRDDLALSAIYDELAGLSHEFPGGPGGRRGLPVVTPSQVKQAAFGRRIVTMKDVAGAIDKAAIADIIGCICQTNWEKRQDPPIMRLFLAKAREAENMGFIWFHQDKDSMTLEECAPVEIPEGEE